MILMQEYFERVRYGRVYAIFQLVVSGSNVRSIQFTIQCDQNVRCQCIYIKYYLKKDFFSDVTRNTQKQVIVRATLPQHFITKSGLGFYSDRLRNETNKCATKVPFPVPHSTNYFLKNMARRFNFSFLDNFSIYYERGDLTKGLKASGKLDCSHHCYTPELIWPELVLLTQIIKE